MIRLLDWYTLARNAKQLNWPKSVHLRNLVLVNVSSAIVIAVGFLPSTSPTDVLSINTGSGAGTILIGDNSSAGSVPCENSGYGV